MSQKFELSPSVSIIIAGVIIAAAIVFTNLRPAPKAGDVVLGADAGAPTAQGALGPALYTKLAQQFGADMGKFNSCVAAKTYQNKIDADSAEAAAVGGQGTPFTLVYNTKTGKSAVVSGALPYDQFSAAIQNAAASEKQLAVRPPSASDHIIGSPTAPIVLIEYSDFQCPFCKMANPIIKRIVSESGGKIAWVYREFPLTSIHPQAGPAANAAECITAQLGNDGFWKFTDVIFN